MNIVAVIPARGGSQGIPNKNLLKINGKTLVEIAVEKCLQVTDRVIVSSDSEEIGEVAYLAGAKWVRRPPELSTNESNFVHALRHALEDLTFDVAFSTNVTSPLTTTGDMITGAGIMGMKFGADLAYSTIKFHGVIVDKDGGWVNHDFSGVSNRRQDMSEQFRMTGGVFAFRKTQIANPTTLFHGRIQPFLAENPIHCDIDTMADYRYAQYLLQESMYE